VVLIRTRPGLFYYPNACHMGKITLDTHVLFNKAATRLPVLMLGDRYDNQTVRVIR
jgi:hypothetical protein